MVFRVWWRCKGVSFVAGGAGDSFGSLKGGGGDSMCEFLGRWWFFFFGMMEGGVLAGGVLLLAPLF